MDKFKKRYNIQFKSLSGKSAEIDFSAAEAYVAFFLSLKLPEIVEGYTAKDRFNADEFRLFRIENPKNRVTVMAAASQEGEKLPLLMIGAAKDPLSFRANQKMVANMNTQYTSSKKAWMNSNIFETWVKDLNDKMRKKHRKIIIFVDNSPSHKLAKEYSHVRIELMPPNLTSVLQPMDQVISQVKKTYRKKMLRRLMNSLEVHDTVTQALKTIDILDIMRWIEDSWNEVKANISFRYHKFTFNFFRYSPKRSRSVFLALASQKLSTWMSQRNQAVESSLIASKSSSVNRCWTRTNRTSSTMTSSPLNTLTVTPSTRSLIS